MKVFSYGSNMLTERLTAKNRAPGAVCIAIGFVRGHVLRFHKRSVDGSGKCDMFRSGIATDLVWGVVFEVPFQEMKPLCRAEGVGNGYAELEVPVEFADGRTENIVAFVAQPNAIDAALRPYAWYRDLVVAGAEEHSLPPEYLSMLRSTLANEDHEPGRQTRLEAEGVLHRFNSRAMHRASPL